MSIHKLSDEQQAEIRRHIKGTKLEQMAILSGALSAPSYQEIILEKMIRKSPVTIALVNTTKKLALVNDPVLITGPTGSGKELVAQLLHGSNRPGKFVPVNTTAIVDTLFESELFGHRKGAFTGANEPRMGLVMQASKGTLFLDEIGDMNLETQAKLLRLIENSEYRVVGDSELSSASCRVVCATHRNLHQLVKEGKFREDLFYRLAVFHLKILPLKERKEDFDLLTAEYDLPEEISDKIWADYPLKGNVRELKSLARHYQVLGYLPSVEESELVEPPKPQPPF